LEGKDSSDAGDIIMQMMMSFDDALYA